MKSSCLGGRILAVGAIVSGLAGCVSVQYGTPPRVERLAALRAGETTPADVLLALGEPRGKGVARLAPDLPARQVWYYEYVKSEGGAVELKLLLILFSANRYDGHLWFGSGLTLRDEP